MRGSISIGWTRSAPRMSALGSDGKLLRETARHLAVRMSYEDVIRVAQAKIDPARLARIEKELNVAAGQPYKVVEFLKPGIEEICQILPSWLARLILRMSEKRGWLDRVHLGMEVNTTSVTGYLRFLMLAKLRRVRRGTFRYAQEQASIESWLKLIRQAADKSAELAIEIAECARLIKGYGSTHKRGTDNFRTIEMRVIWPALEGQSAAASGHRRDCQRPHCGAGRSRRRRPAALHRHARTRADACGGGIKHRLRHTVPVGFRARGVKRPPPSASVRPDGRSPLQRHAASRGILRGRRPRSAATGE